MTRRLHIVPPPSPQGEPEDALDLTALARAEIMKRDWSRCHIEGDRRKPWRTLVWKA